MLCACQACSTIPPYILHYTTAVSARRSPLHHRCACQTYSTTSPLCAPDILHYTTAVRAKHTPLHHRCARQTYSTTPLLCAPYILHYTTAVRARPTPLHQRCAWQTYSTTPNVVRARYTPLHHRRTPLSMHSCMMVPNSYGGKILYRLGQGSAASLISRIISREAAVYVFLIDAKIRSE